MAEGAGHGYQSACCVEVEGVGAWDDQFPVFPGQSVVEAGECGRRALGQEGGGAPAEVGVELPGDLRPVVGQACVIELAQRVHGAVEVGKCRFQGLEFGVEAGLGVSIARQGRCQERRWG
ncbi:hypothetical protein [Actinoallomurus sp. NPDC050550]|uniref:hypothetical protein n=1 Tax=Actinoallomurus sp. NPDC050550 TaxID=3154937 RepID=UPI0033C47119